MIDLLRSSVFIKVCGLTRPAEVQSCLEMGINATGFIFVPGSPRELSPERAAAMPRGKALRVGVFANSGAAKVLQIADQVSLDLIQLHGGESVEYCRALGTYKIIKVLWPQAMGNQELQAAIDAFAPFCCAFLFDAGKTGGGSGQVFDWRKLTALRIPLPWILAGGLNRENLEQALGECAPRAIDLNSGVELAPGLKDIKLIREIRNSI